MTDATTATRMTLDDLAHLAVSDPSKLQPSDVTRLGDFILDHEEHLAFHRRMTGGGMFQGRQTGGATNGSLARRLEAQRPMGALGSGDMQQGPQGLATGGLQQPEAAIHPDPVDPPETEHEPGSTA